MRNLTLALVALSFIGGTLACDGGPQGSAGLSPTNPLPLAYKKGTPKGCVGPANAVVTTEAELQAALAAAGPGDVIALDGMIALTVDVDIFTPDLTLTCATAGSGLSVAAGKTVYYLVSALADRIRVAGIRLDATDTQSGAVLAVRGTGGGGLDGVQVTDNEITAGPAIAVFFIGVRNALVSANTVHASQAATGLHLQGQGGVLPDGSREFPTDGSVVSRNTVIADQPTGASVFGAIRVRDGAGVDITQNDLLGPWSTAMAVTRLADGVIDKNRVEGPQFIGVLFQASGGDPIRGMTFANNRVSGTDVGLRVALSCGNLFRGNNLNGNATAGAVFESTTGANVYRGNGNVVVDDGATDCDGDGVIDPNDITGH